MAIDIPANEQAVIDQSRADVQEILPEANPFLRNSMLDAILTANGGRIFDFYRNLDELQKQLFIDTATEDLLERLASFRNITRNPATPSSGNVIFTGTVATVIPFGTTLQSLTAQGFTTQSATDLSIIGDTVSITRVGTVATVAMDTVPHEQAIGLSITIAGAVETEYNGTFVIDSVISQFIFTYTVTGSPATPATGAPAVTTITPTASTPIESDDEGGVTNLDANSPLTIGSPIAGVDPAPVSDFDGISGGTDEENDDDFRARSIDKWQNPNTPFNTARIISQVQLVPGVTRVFVFEITPNVGQVTVYFMRDNDLDPIPSAGEVATVKAKLLEIKPANTADEDVIVLAPTALPVSFTITGISPDTLTMKTAIEANLEQLFSEGTNVSVDLLRNDYISAINRTVDTESGDILQAFTVTSPVGDVTVATGELPTLDTVTIS